MALIAQSTYQPKRLFRSKHFNTIYRTLFQKIDIDYERERLETRDGDFMDLDFSRIGSKKVVVIVHGLEGSSNSNYMKSLGSILNNQGFDVVALNLRGCSGEINRLLSSYHSGKTDDLAEVLHYIDTEHSYKSVSLVGFSLGGNLVLKYLGEKRNDYPATLGGAVTISVPCDLKGSSDQIAKFWNMVYMQRFLISLKNKSLAKIEQFPNSYLRKEVILNVRNFYDFDNLYTAPVHGFIDAEDYWKQSSSKQFISGIKHPCLLITATDDPFLSESCIPVKEAKDNTNFHLEITAHGGHVGFNSNFNEGSGFWLENRICGFINEKMS